MIPIVPQEYFTIARGLEDHTDNTVFFVRATVRNARTDALIETVDLVNRGDNHRFSYAWRAPADPSGEGFYILVTTSVYIDSGYALKSEQYGDKYDTYLVMDRVRPHGGGDVDYKRVRKIVREELEAMAKPDAAPFDYGRIEKALQDGIGSIPEPKAAEVPPVDLAPLMDAVAAVLRAVEAIRIPEPERLDLSPILAKIDEIIIEVSHPEIADEQLKPLHDLRDSFAEMVDEKRKGLDRTTETAEKALATIREFFTRDVEEIMKGIKGLNHQISEINCIVLNKKGESL